jgi:hypothetical protein
MMSMRLPSWIRWSLPIVLALAFAAPAAAQDEEEAAAQDEEEAEDSAPYGLGPLEFAPTAGTGNVGAPRSAVPETRFGIGLHWVTYSESVLGGDYTLNGLGLLLEAHLELLDVLEVGVDIEAMQYASIDTPAGSDSTKDFGFITPRVKFAFVNTDMFTLAFGLGVALPTASGDQWDTVTPLALDPGLFAAFRLFGIVSINGSLSFPTWILVPDSGDTQTEAFFTPQVGVTVMPIPYIGGFVDFQFHVYLNPDQPTDPADPRVDNFQLMNLILGVRSMFLPWMMGEIGAIIPLAGDISDHEDFGLGIRIVAMPDIL